MAMMELKKVSLAYGKNKILDEIDLKAEKGEIIGLVAPNGTGKTTLFKVMANFLKPDAGKVLIDGKHQYKSEKEELKIHKQLASFPEQHDLMEEISGRDHINLYANMWKGSTKDVQGIIDYLQMNSYVHRKVSTYSMGMRQRLCFAMMVAADTTIMLMDEVMNGLDVENVDLISKQLITMKAQGKLIFVASHLLSNLDIYANRILFLKDGNFIHEYKLNDQNDDYLKVEMTESERLEIEQSFTLPPEYLFIADHLLCIRLSEMTMKERMEWIEVMLEKDFPVTIEPLGTVDYYERYYHERK